MGEHKPRQHRGESLQLGSPTAERVQGEHSQHKTDEDSNNEAFGDAEDAGTRRRRRFPISKAEGSTEGTGAIREPCLGVEEVGEGRMTLGSFDARRDRNSRMA